MTGFLGHPHPDKGLVVLLGGAEVRCQEERTLVVSPGKDDMEIQDSRMFGMPGDVKREDDSEMFWRQERKVQQVYLTVPHNHMRPCIFPSPSLPGNCVCVSERQRHLPGALQFTVFFHL